MPFLSLNSKLIPTVILVGASLALIILSIPKARSPGAAEAKETAVEVLKGKDQKAPQGAKFKNPILQPYRNAPPFKVISRKEGLEMYPCSDCHEEEPINPRERDLKEEHENIRLEHGGERFWCLTCHNIRNNSDTFISMKNKPIDFDKAYLLCGQCHFQRQRDWYFGGHGKRMGAWPRAREIPPDPKSLLVRDRTRIGSWKGPRVILSCPECHDPHSPSIKPFSPSPPPQVRRGLSRKAGKPVIHIPIWESLAGKLGATHGVR